MRKQWGFDVYALVTPKGAIVRHIEGSSLAPMLFRSRWEAAKMAKQVGVGSEVIRVDVTVKRRFR